MKLRERNEYGGGHTLTTKGWAVLIIAGLLIGSLLLSPFIFYDKVDQNEYGLRYRGWTSSLVSEDVYEGGRHYTGLTGSFITFPSTQQTIQYYTSEDNSVNGRTEDGLEIYLDVSFQYQLRKSGIVELYNNFGSEYEAVFWRIARDVIRDITSVHSALEFSNNRTIIGAEIEVAMFELFDTVYNTDIAAFQLLEIILPTTFDDALERAEVARQEIITALLEQEIALIEAETRIFEAEAQYNVTLINAQAEADAFLTMINAQAEAVNITLTAQTEAYYALSQALNMTSAELLAFLWIEALTEIGEFGNLIIIGENTPFIAIESNSTINT